MASKRLQVYTHPELKRRIELAALKNNLPVTQYCLEAILDRLDNEEMLDKDRITVSVREEDAQAVIEEIHRLQQDIAARRKGKRINVAKIINRLRDEQDYESAHLR